VFFPIWPDLEPGPSSTSRRRPEPDRPTIPGPEDSAA
jgi:hypothetical protein